MISNLLWSRQLVNGAQEKVKVATEHSDFTRKAWFSDAVLLSQSLSKGDRSVPLEAMALVNAGEQTGFLTVQGSVTQELWQRMSHFGYGTSKPVEKVPGARNFTPNPKAFGLMVSFLMATQVDVMTRRSVKKVSAALSRDYQKWSKLQWSKLPRDGMVQLRIAFDRQQPITAPPKEKNTLFNEFMRAGVVGSPNDTEWPVTNLGMTNMPFIFDHLIFQKDEYLRKANA